MRKRTVAIILLVALVVSSAFAYSNQQKIYSVDSGVYKAMETLYILAGKSLPSSSGPWSEAELQLMLDRIDRSSISQSAQNYYDYVKAQITSEPKNQFSDNFAMQFGMDADLEVYFHTNEEFKDSDEWFHGYTYRNPLLRFTFETWPTDHFYGYFELTVGNSMGRVGDNELYKTKFTFNVPIADALLFTKADILCNFDWSFPARAFVAAGGNHWSLMAGRDKLSWGSGETGNLMLSDSFPKHTMVMFSTFFNAFKYSLVGTIYPLAVANQDTSLDGYKAMIVHRLEFNLLSNKLSLIVNEACMFWSDPSLGNQQFSLAQINPFGFMHNEYIRRNANSLLVFEANYTPLAGLNIYGQLAVDEFNGPGEGKYNPAAFGYILGVKGAMARDKGIVTGSLEFVRTDPYLYIRGFTYDDPTKGYGYDAIYRSFKNDGLVNRNMFTTYRYGNDVMIFDGKVGYQLPGVFKVGIEAMYRVHGSMNVNSYWGAYHGDNDQTPVVSTPTTYNPFDPNDYQYGHEPDYSDGVILQEHAVEKSIILSLSGEYCITDGLTANLAADFLFVTDKGNVADNKQNDIQITAGIKYSI